MLRSPRNQDIAASRQRNNLQRILQSLFRLHVARYHGQCFHLELWRIQSQDDCHRVISARIGVDNHAPRRSLSKDIRQRSKNEEQDQDGSNVQLLHRRSPFSNAAAARAACQRWTPTSDLPSSPPASLESQAAPVHSSCSLFSSSSGMITRPAVFGSSVSGTSIFAISRVPGAVMITALSRCLGSM